MKSSANSDLRRWPLIHRRTRICHSGIFAFTILLVVFGVTAQLQAAQQDTPSRAEIAAAARGRRGSSYIPLDSWIYPAAIRLYELGYLPTAYLGMRPWTRISLAHMLELSRSAVQREGSNSEAVGIFDALYRELAPELQSAPLPVATVDTIYTRVREIHGSILNDSYHLGQTIINDNGRPYQPGLNNIIGYSVVGTAERFNLFVRGEYQHAPSGVGCSTAVADALSYLDQSPNLPQFTIPKGRIASQNNVRLLEANLSVHLLGHQVSFGKDDAWLGPGQGSSMAWSNNAENIYSFRINRVEPLFIPGLSRLTGIFRYDFFVGSLKGHNDPNDPWIHSTKISFKPTPDLELGFQRSVIWGGKGHVPITIGTFLRSFFSVSGVSPAVKFSRNDPGARFSTFDFTWRVPWRNHLLTVYTDSLVHDNVFPVSNPGRAGLRPGLYVSRLPGMPYADFRVEGATTNPHDPGDNSGQFLYFEAAQKQGYTNRGQIIGDWIGREGTGGQAWLTWHLQPNESVQLEYRTAKAASDFIPGGTTQQSSSLHLIMRATPNLEMKATVQGELWRAPLVHSGTQHNFVGTVHLTYFPHMTLGR